RRGSGLHISEIRRRAENPLAAKKQCVRYSHPIVSQNQTKSDGAKTPVCISNRKKSKCHLSRCVTKSYVDMRMRQPDSSEDKYSSQVMNRDSTKGPLPGGGFALKRIADSLIDRVCDPLIGLLRQVSASITD